MMELRAVISKLDGGCGTRVQAEMGRDCCPPFWANNQGASSSRIATGGAIPRCPRARMHRTRRTQTAIAPRSWRRCWHLEMVVPTLTIFPQTELLPGCSRGSRPHRDEASGWSCDRLSATPCQCSQEIFRDCGNCSLSKTLRWLYAPHSARSIVFLFSDNC
ncbi:hypothetical protein MPTK1_2g22925 [Marchantia polymorpha subsp. ruderalis]